MERNSISIGQQDVLAKLRSQIHGMTWEAGNDLVNLYAVMEGAEVAWASMRRVKFHSTSGMLQILLRRYKEGDSTVPIERYRTRVTPQGTWVYAPSTSQAVSILMAHKKDLDRRSEDALSQGKKLFDGRARRLRPSRRG